MIVSIHIPKTAGTSFRLILQRWYEPSELLFFHIRHKSPEYPDGEPTDFTQLQMVNGHYKYKELIQLFPNWKQASFITWLRNPVDRVVSNYLYLLEQSVSSENSEELRNQLAHRINEGLIEFASNPRNQNRMSTFLNGIELENFYFIGIVEHFSTDLEALSRKLKKPFTSEFLLKVNQRKNDVSAFSQEILQEIAQLNSEDINLCNTALEKRALGYWL